MARKKTGSKRWPPNIGVNNGNVRYRRQMPKDLSSIVGKKVYQEYLSTLTPESSFEDAYEAAKPVTARYEALVKSLKNSSIDAYTENEIEALAAAYLKDTGLAPSGLALHMVGPEFLKKHGLEDIEDVLGRPVTTTDLMLLFFPRIADPIARRDAAQTEIQKLRAGLGINEKGLFTDGLRAEPTIQEIAQYRAAEVATNVKSRQPRTLSWWWNDYLEYNNLTDPSDRVTKRKQRHWERFLSLGWVITSSPLILSKLLTTPWKSRSRPGLGKCRPVRASVNYLRCSRHLIEWQKNSGLNGPTLKCPNLGSTSPRNESHCQ